MRKITDLDPLRNVHYKWAHGVTIRILTGFSGVDYTVSDVDGDIATEFVNSQAELGNVLKAMGMPPKLIEDTLRRLSHMRLVEVMFEPRRR